MSTRIPGPRGRFFIGSAPEFNRDTLNFLRSMRDYGDIAQFYVGPVPLVVVSHPDLAREVLVTQAAKFSKNEYTKRVLAPYIGLGLFTSEGDFWKHQRHLMQPMFHTRYIGHYAETMVAYADDLARIWQDGEVRAIDKEMSQLTMRVIGKSLFDADVNNDGAAIGELITHSLKLIEEELQAVFTLPAWVPTRFHRGTRYVAAEQNALIQGFIDTRRASQEDRLDLLSLLLNARDENGQPMPDQQVRA
ncbi:MAG TPA: cytochrome P450, partial [Aggregatilineales bacterium]|nr:cytochrome P450 [Aggregatilineales bacterium]